MDAPTRAACLDHALEWDIEHSPGCPACIERHSNDLLRAQLAEAKEENAGLNDENVVTLNLNTVLQSRITRLEGAISSAILTLEGIQGICWPKVSGVVRILKAALPPEAEDVGKGGVDAS